MKALAAALFAAAAWPATPPKPNGCAVAMDVVKRASAAELPRELFSNRAVVRLYGETAAGQDLGHKDLTPDEYHGIAGELLSAKARYREVRCVAEGGDWLVLAVRSTGRTGVPTPVSFLFTIEAGAYRIVSASFVEIVD